MTELVSFNEKPQNTWFWRQEKKFRKFVSCEEVFNEDGDGGMYVHTLKRNSKPRRKRRMMVGGRR